IPKLIGEETGRMLPRRRARLETRKRLWYFLRRPGGDDLARLGKEQRRTSPARAVVQEDERLLEPSPHGNRLGRLASLRIGCSHAFRVSPGEGTVGSYPRPYTKVPVRWCR